VTETNEQYHADTAYHSHSMLSIFGQSRRKFQRRFVSKFDPPTPPTPQMMLGTLTHLALLEPSRYAAEVVGSPKFDRRTKQGKADAEAFEAASVGKLTCNDEQAAIIKAIMANVADSPKAKQLLWMTGPVEQSIRWQDSATGLLCKCRPDKLTDVAIVDVKTSRDPSPAGFSRAAADLGYHRQARWYQRGLESLGKHLPFVFVVVGTESPHQVAAYQLDDDAMTLAENQINTRTRQLRDCYKHQDWREPWEKQVTTIALPKWAVYADEFEIFD